MGLVEQWERVAASLPADWASARVGVELSAGESETAATLLAPLQPLRSATDQAFAILIGRDGRLPSPDALRRGLTRLEARGVAGKVSLLGAESAAAAPALPPSRSLVASWQAALETVPPDWSELLAEVELDSSDYLDAAAVQLAPINPRLIGQRTVLRFRSASRFGYGASPGVVAACLARCDRDGIRGRVRVLEALSDTRPVGTQGPVWRIAGQTA